MRIRKPVSQSIRRKHFLLALACGLLGIAALTALLLRGAHVRRGSALTYHSFSGAGVEMGWDQRRGSNDAIFAGLGLVNRTSEPITIDQIAPLRMDSGFFVTGVVLLAPDENRRNFFGGTCGKLPLLEEDGWKTHHVKGYVLKPNFPIIPTIAVHEEVQRAGGINGLRISYRRPGGALVSQDFQYRGAFTDDKIGLTCRKLDRVHPLDHRKFRREHPDWKTILAE